MTLSVFATKDRFYTPGYVFQLINREFDAAFLCQGTELFRRLGSFDLLLLLGGKGGKVILGNVQGVTSLNQYSHIFIRIL